MFCTKCGEELISEAKFCRKCGAEVKRRNNSADIKNKREVDKSKKWLKIGIVELVVGWIMMMLGLFMPDPNSGIGLWMVICGAVIMFIGPITLIISAILTTKEPGKTGLKCIGIFVVEFAIIGLGIALDLGAICTGVLGAVVLIIALCIKGTIDNTACPKCGKKLAMKEISRKTVSSYATTVDVVRNVKNNKGEVIRTYTEAVPATRYTCDCVDECKFCGHRQNVRRDVTYRN